MQIMAEEKIDIEVVKKYLSGELTTDERSFLDKRLQEDTVLKKEFGLYKTMVIAMEEHYDEALKETLKKEDINKTKKNRSIFVPLMVAASVVTILIVSYAFFKYSKVTSPQELYSEYYKPYYNVIDDYKRGSDLTTSETEAFKLYEQKEYESAIKAFENGLSGNPENTPLLFYGGLSYLAVEKPDEAITMLMPVASSNHNLKEAAEWYLALAYLKNNNLLQSQKLLEDIAGSEGAYKEKAMSLLRELR